MRFKQGLFAGGVAVAMVLSLGTVPEVRAASGSTPTPAALPSHPLRAAAPIAANYQALCGPADPGYARCFALRRTDMTATPAIAATPNAAPSGYGPADLVSAYALPGGTAGSGFTVAVVDAYNSPTAEADLAVYRAQYGLPACTTANGCFRKIDQYGGTNYPVNDAGWAGEISLDLDMVSAICPNCHILLVEANSANFFDLATAVSTAASQGAIAISNSYGGLEWAGAPALDTYFHHPGIAVTASTGDCGYECAPNGSDLYYGVQYPASSRYVVSVGGTSLTRAGNARGWTEAAWGDAGTRSGAGSGCSDYETKPSWQHDSGCANRMSADVSAVADPNTGVAVYYTGGGGWTVYGGTSASAPIVASLYALASGLPGSDPASYIYSGSAYLNDVTAGSNDVWGDCADNSDPAYYCTAVAGYDGPTGLGTPNGIRAFNSLNATYPSVPRTVTATAGTHGATVSWLAPGDNGGTSISGYTVTSSPTSAGCTTSGALSCYVFGLTPGTSYTFNVTARNAIGSSPVAGPSNAISPLGQISGTISDTHGNRLSGLTVTAVDGTLQVAATATTNASGYFSLVPRTGSYTIHVSDPGGTWPAGNYALGSPGNWSAGTATSVDLASTDVTGIDLNLPDAFDIRGHVSNGTSGLAGITVSAYGCAGNCVIGTATTAADGAYGLPVVPGSYMLGFSDPGGMYQSGFWDGSGYTADQGSAALVGVVDADVTAIDVTLPFALSKPTNVAATPLDGGATVTWSAPDHDGGSSITGYSVSSGPSGPGCAWSSGPLSCTVSGLLNGTTYAFRVTATNADGATAQSSPSAPIVPVGLPWAPWGPQVTGGMKSATVTWTAAFANGSPITSYTVSSTPASAGCATTGATSCTVPNLTPGTAYTFQIRATNAVGTGPWSEATRSVVPTSNGDTYYAIPPSRLLDTRNGTGGLGIFHSHVAQGFTVAGRGGVPTRVTAVTGNLTVTEQTSAGFLSLGPAPANDPTSSTLNFPRGDDRANAVTVQLSPDGKLYITYAAPIRNTPTAHVIFDVTGYFGPDAGGATYYPVNPTRILDTRDNTGGLGVFHSHVPQGFGVAGRGGVPSNATAVTGNLTVTQQTSAGFLSLGPMPEPDPTSSTLNFPLRDDRANAVTVALSYDGTLYITYAAPVRNTPTAQVIFDVTGYFVRGMGGAVYVPIAPTRVLDSRDRTGGLSVFHSHVAQGLTVRGQATVPAEAVAITGNLTVTQQSSLGFLAIGPVTADDPASSNLNFPLGDDRANAVTVALSPDGKLYVTFAAPVRNTPTAQVILDVTGYFTN